ncbi:MAG TPA: hypothetical protein VI933_02610 [archaeon]|nr:hypothetical protein [archaeon]
MERKRSEAILIIMKILLDTNFLIECSKRRVDFFRELAGSEFFIIQSVAEELSAISDGKTKDAKFASAAKNILEKVNFVPEPEKTEGDADASLLELSKKNFVVATQDKELREKILKAKGKIILLKANRKFETK